jgi:NADPH:quinone reductase-like Zn-dependent oxidoreductase
VDKPPLSLSQSVPALPDMSGGLPYVVVSCAVSLDGATTRRLILSNTEDWDRVDALAAREIRGINFGNSPTPAELETLAALADAGTLRVTITAEVPLADAAAAVAHARSGHARGKTVIVP